MIVELAFVAHLNLSPINYFAKGSSGGRSGSSRSTAPKTATPKTEVPKTENKTTQNSTTQNSASTAPKKVDDHKGKLDDKSKFNNKDGKQVVYRESGINWFQTWFLFGWLWHNPDNDKCYDNDHKPITCEKEKKK